MGNNRKRILYGEANYLSIVEKNGYYVDKTAFIPELERFDNPVYLRPRRFGKSLTCTGNRLQGCTGNLLQGYTGNRL